MPLNLEEVKPADDLEAFQLQVVKTMKKYAKAHDWCDVANQALREVGLDPNMAEAASNRVIVDVTVSGRIELDIPLEDFIGKSSAEQREHMAGLLRVEDSTFIADTITGDYAEMNEAVITVSDINRWERTPETFRNLVVPEGSSLWFTSTQGRMRHLYLGGDHPRMWDTNWCGGIFTAPTKTSTLDNGNMCKKCEVRLAGMQ